MSANMTLVVLIGLLGATGVNLLLRRTLTKMLIGTILLGNAVNLLILAAGGPSGAPPIVGAAPGEPTADPLAQAMILTAIVISLGVAAFVLALAYRSYRLQTDEDVDDDVEDESVAQRAEFDGEAEPDDEPAKVDVGDTEGQLRT
ncbi:NADH-ubiquinone oxidoreductase chain 4L [Segniliparus rotundus DSM 44985]|uniref:NADH-ubiquinone oxidoreductase chain 4L n=1 Tax=Segniliparus rotundus (strain ATCC BAA-972 / CDC 1076 / CIP 108378 / DSM 44985 / JCM 13578) TaxID=640132 RepID=D6ZB98_SEGRD|nr:Na(+)/H(+) antiporter subunit C [Segniliparus rotundus]ADG96857.1 NADH-ubiquinone oxidoreductase chain 4L [Segniliparus rotundus DSM 44985]